MDVRLDSEEEELEFWLRDKPDGWARIVAVRAALRALPLIGSASMNWIDHFALIAIRANAMSWAANNLPSYGFEHAANLAAKDAEIAVLRAAYVKDSDHPYAAMRAFAAAGLAADAITENDAASATFGTLIEARAASSSAVSLPAAKEMARSILGDCFWLAERQHDVSAVRILSRRSLWLGTAPKWWLSQWDDLAFKLVEIDANYLIWINWFERRIRGERAAFDIPGDKRRIEDKVILRRLAAATGEDFWGRGHDHVNATLMGWLEEARERVGENVARASKNRSSQLNQGRPTTIPVQSNTALRFAPDPEGKIALSPDTDLSELRRDEDARDRHRLAVEDAKQLLAACTGLNSAERLTAILTAYIAAAGETLEEMRPSLFVQKGERLRQELARYEAGDTDLPPLPDRVLLDLKSVCKAHNMVVGLDPALMARDTAQLPPDAVVGDVTPDEVRDFVHGADEAGILQSDVPDIMDEAVALVPPGADASDRRFRWCVESCRNLVIEAFAIALNKPVTTTAIIAGSYALGPQALVGNTLAFGVFLVSRRQWIEERLGRHAPTWQALFIDLCERLEKHTPLSETTKNK